MPESVSGKIEVHAGDRRHGLFQSSVQIDVHRASGWFLAAMFATIFAGAEAIESVAGGHRRCERNRTLCGGGLAKG